MFIKDAEMLVTNMSMKEMQDHTPYCAVGLLSLDDGQKFDVSIREHEIFGQLKLMTKVVLDMELSSSKYGLKLAVKNVVDIGNRI